MESRKPAREYRKMYIGRCNSFITCEALEEHAKNEKSATHANLRLVLIVKL